LWKGVADLEQVEHDLQARLQATGSRSCVGEGKEAVHLELKAAQEEERQLVEKLASVESRWDLGEGARRRSTRLRARIARLQQECQEISEEVLAYRNSSQELEAEVEHWRAKLRLREEEERRNEEVEVQLKPKLMALLPHPVAEDSLFELARLVGRTWAEARSRGEARKAELDSLKEHQHKLANLTVAIQAEVEAESQRLLVAEEELAFLKSERRTQGRQAKEELAVARAEHKVLSEDRSLWLQTRPRLLSLIDDLQRPSPSKAHGGRRQADEALQAAAEEKQELQAMINALEGDKAALIQEQEEMIQRVRERVAPLQDRLVERSRRCM